MPSSRNSSRFTRHIPVVALLTLALVACGGGGGSLSSAGATPPTSQPPVTQPAQATLSWLPPTENTDGTALSDLAGYVILYGTSPSTLDKTVRLDNPGLTRYVIEGLTPGTWYFAMQSINTRGVTSDLSEVVSKTIS
jgi:hypothetical protein